MTGLDPTVYRTAAEVAVVHGEEMTLMVVICAWCRSDLGYKAGYGVSGPTAGVCRPCMDAELERIESRKSRGCF